LLYKLAGQVVARVKSYLANDAEVENVLLRHGRQLADFIFAQMMNHYRETPLGEDDYEVTVTRGFMLFQAQAMNVPSGQRVRDFRQAVAPLSDTRKHVFGGFTKCCYPLQKFDTDPERRLAVIIDGDASAEKWIKPGSQPVPHRLPLRGSLRTGFRRRNQGENAHLRGEGAERTRRRGRHGQGRRRDEVVQDSDGARAGGGTKPWVYLLIPDDQIRGHATVDGLVARFALGICVSEYAHERRLAVQRRRVGCGASAGCGGHDGLSSPLPHRSLRAQARLWRRVG
jgi:type III restriction enzyme